MRSGAKVMAIVLSLERQLLPLPYLATEIL